VNNLPVDICAEPDITLFYKNLKTYYFRIAFDCLLTYFVYFSLATLHAKLSGTVYCNRSCLWVCLCVCYHDNSKLHALILTKLVLSVKVVTISS